MSRVRAVFSAVILFVLFWFVFGGEWPAATQAFARPSQVPPGEGVDRDSWQRPEKVMDAIGVKAGMTIGEVGAGNGYFTFKLAARVGPAGLIYANDIDQGALQDIKATAKRRKIENIVTVRGEVADPLFPPAIMDLVIMVYVFHDLAEPVKLLQNLKLSLKPTAPLVILERDPDKMASAKGHFYQRERFLELVREAGYELVRVETFLSRDNIYVLRPEIACSPSTNQGGDNREPNSLPTGGIAIKV